MYKLPALFTMYNGFPLETPESRSANNAPFGSGSDGSCTNTSRPYKGFVAAHATREPYATILSGDELEIPLKLAAFETAEPACKLKRTSKPDKILKQ